MLYRCMYKSNRDSGSSCLRDFSGSFFLRDAVQTKPIYDMIDVVEKMDINSLKIEEKCDDVWIYWMRT